MQDPIRYAVDDPIEDWLNKLLLLNATQASPLQSGLPHPKKCDLYLLNKDTLFSYHKASEMFLHKLMSLFISSHYRNSPDDILLMSDSPGHYIFVLLGPVKDAKKNSVPDILCVALVSLEGKIPK
jgi:N-acetyltransferase 10